MLAKQNTSTGQIWTGNDPFVVLALTKELTLTEVGRGCTCASDRLKIECQLQHLGSVILVMLHICSELLPSHRYQIVTIWMPKDCCEEEFKEVQKNFSLLADTQENYGYCFRLSTKQGTVLDEKNQQNQWGHICGSQCVSQVCSDQSALNCHMSTSFPLSECILSTFLPLF